MYISLLPTLLVDVLAVHTFHVYHHDLLEPRPSQDSMAALDALGDLEWKLVDTVGLVLRCACNGRVEVANCIARTATQNRVDDFPVAGVFLLRGIGLIGDTDLTRASTMNRRIGAASELECERLGRASRHRLSAGLGKRNTVAGEVAARRVEGVLWECAWDGRGRGDEHVRVYYTAKEEGRCGEDFEDGHVG